MANGPGARGKGGNAAAGGPVAPQISLPKGGGAIRDIGEKLAANPITGTATLSVPIHASPGRSGFGPQLSLSYDSGSGNSPFGFGWALPVPTITRKTDKGLPRYIDTEESDTFILSGAEDLVPALLQTAGQWHRDVVAARSVYGQRYSIHRYRPRVESLFSRIERWVNLSDPTDTFWRSISRDNITSWYGKSAASRIADAAEPSRIFSWLLCESYDDNGNAISYRYKREDSQNIDLSSANERNRSSARRSTQLYLKDVVYGNRTPYFPDLTATTAVALPTDWCFQLVLDYGEHDLAAPTPDDSATAWSCRLDPFSTYRPTFEVRTYRLCRRALLFHHFADQPAVGLNCLVGSTDLTHASTPPADPSQPFYSYLLSISQSGYVRNGGGYTSDSLPPLEFEYSQAVIDETIRDVDPDSLKNLPSGIDGAYRWVDLDGEGVSGILTEQASSWFYKPNLSPANFSAADNPPTTPRFGAVRPLPRKPSLAALSSGGQQLMDLSGDGRMDLVEFDGPAPGFYERTSEGNWEPWRAFTSLPVLDWHNPNLRFIDLTGDGFPDLLISEDQVFWWHASLSTRGFGPAHRVMQAFDEEKGPRIVFSDGTDSIFLADMSGDGLTDLVRVRSTGGGEVCYWPNLGYGRFGSKVTMDGAPRFDRLDQFDARRLRLADIDGSGTTDLIYLAAGEVHLYFNQSGNAWGPRRALTNFPLPDSTASATPLDLLGNGTSCLAWSSALPSATRRPMRYIDLMSGQKPHLLTRVVNNLGAESVVEYAPSTKFYVADKLSGTPWLTRLPFPVQVVERVETYDYISRNRFVSRYSYHHGYYDGVEREFRGFGRVDQWDTEELATLSASSDFPPAANESSTSNVPPVWTRTWFHTGAFFSESLISKYLEREYYSEGDSSDAVAGLSSSQLEAMLLDDTVLPTTALLPDGSRLPYDLSGEEMREACRALRGFVLRQEIYSLGAADASDRPYSVSERNYTIELLQPQGPNPYGAFESHPRETLDFHYERQLYPVSDGVIADQTPLPATTVHAADPRVTHALTLAIDPFGNVTESAVIGYGRRYLDPGLTAKDQARQSTPLCTYSQHTYTNPVITDDAYRTPLPAESSQYELIQLQPDASQPDLTNLFRFDELQIKLASIDDGLHDLAYENTTPSGLTPGQTYRRLTSRERTLYRPDDMGAAAGSAKALLPLGSLESLALAGAHYDLVFTPGLISQVYQRAAVQLLPTPGNVLGSAGSDGGGYVDLDTDGHWWLPSPRVYYLPVAPTPLAEKTQAQQHFFMPRRFEDPFGNATALSYDDPHDLLLTSTTDPLGNTASAINDYRVLAPGTLTDPNGNRIAASFDALGRVAGTALMGKITETLGDSLSGFQPDLTQAQIDSLYGAADPTTLAATFLGLATTRVIYNTQQFVSTRTAAPDDPTKWAPVFSVNISRETHVSDLPSGATSRLQIAFEYSDGYGRTIQKKSQAEPGPLITGGPSVAPRWVGSGWTIFNNKGQPVRHYEPFFSQLPAQRHQFEFGARVGVSSILLYDPLERVVVTLKPNQAYEKVGFDPWSQTSWDVNDTVLQTDPTADPDVGAFFQLIPTADYSPTWYSQRIGGSLGSQEQDAATKAAAHANTPTVSYFDPLGRTFLTVRDNGGGNTVPARHELDIEGNQRAVRDAIVQAGDLQGRTVVRYDYDMLHNVIHQASMEAGEQWMLHDVAGNAIRKWDSRGHNFRTAYDALRRPTGFFVFGTDSSQSDPRTTAAEILYEQMVWGEGQPDTLNLKTRLFQHSDGGGTVTQAGFDFKGNLLRSNRSFIDDYKKLPDWTAPPALTQTFSSSTQYDALNRPTALTTPDGSIARPGYNEASLLESVSVNLKGTVSTTAFITDIDYNARGQRLAISFGNGSSTALVYDPLTYRLARRTTTRPGATNQATVQDLAYWYDPAGNVTRIEDTADTQNVVFFLNQRVDPTSDYTYDALYRLVQAIGREQLGLSGNTPLPPTPSSYNDVPRIGLISPSDGNAMGTYTESYQYDATGNFTQFAHRGTKPSNPGWSRTYAYNEPSLLEPGKTNNRLSRSTVNGSQPLAEPYTYDAHGNTTSMPQLNTMQWDFKDQLCMTQRQVVNATDAAGVKHQGERTYYVYDFAGQRVRKTTESAQGIKLKERFYLGGFEVFSRYDPTAAVTLQRETLHVLDDQQTIALVETRTLDSKSTEASLPAVVTRYQVANHLGTCCLELDASAALITYEEHYPFGGTAYQAGRTVIEVKLKRYRYSGKERDSETGLYYYGMRFYAPWQARWISCDPAGLIDGPNVYAFVNDNPTRRTDDSGLNSDDKTEPKGAHGEGKEHSKNTRQKHQDANKRRQREQEKRKEKERQQKRDSEKKNPKNETDTERKQRENQERKDRYKKEAEKDRQEKEEQKKREEEERKRQEEKEKRRKKPGDEQGKDKEKEKQQEKPKEQKKPVDDKPKDKDPTKPPNPPIPFPPIKPEPPTDQPRDPPDKPKEPDKPPQRPPVPPPVLPPVLPPVWAPRPWEVPHIPPPPPAATITVGGVLLILLMIAASPVGA